MKFSCWFLASLCCLLGSGEHGSIHHSATHETNEPVGTTALPFDCVEVDLGASASRRPIAVAACGSTPFLVVANQQSGTISVVDAERLTVLGEYKVATQIGDMVPWHENQFLITDRSQAGALLCIQVSQTGTVAGLWKQASLAFPNKICIGNDKQWCFVGGLWSRQIGKHDLTQEKATASQAGEPGRLQEVTDLSFAVGELALFQDGSTVLATDAFGSQWASLQALDLSFCETGDFGSRRICGVANWLDSSEPETQKFAVVIQPLNRLAQAIRNDVHWGLMVANEIAIRDEATFVQADWQESRRTTIPLGGPGEAKGDPESIVFSGAGEVAITIGGVNQLALGDLDDRSFAYIPTGRRPLGCCFADNDRKVVTADSLDDTLTVIDVEKYEVIGTLSLGKQPPTTALERGERLFFDATVSHDSWMSCHSCHVEAHTNGFLNDNFSDQSFGAPKRVLSLLGHGDTAPFAWNGSAQTLEEQVRSSMEVTMQTDQKFSDEQVADLAEFVRRLPAPPSLADARNRRDPALIRSGKQLFMDLNCDRCHQGKNYTSSELRQVGLEDELGKKEFNPPSLIGVSQRQQFFHDARFQSLADLFTKNRHQLPREISDAELQQLLSFLKSL
ncbi:MAG: cytochrome c peroxidase [Pirellulaceae bacterium]|nr:cytochrome c peroxidase [Pirellulaceae bacterium]